MKFHIFTPEISTQSSESSDLKWTWWTFWSKQNSSNQKREGIWFAGKVPNVETSKKQRIGVALSKMVELIFAQFRCGSGSVTDCVRVCVSPSWAFYIGLSDRTPIGHAYVNFLNQESAFCQEVLWENYPLFQCYVATQHVDLCGWTV